MKSKTQAFAFGDPHPVLDRADILNYAQCTWHKKWYEPPLSWVGLAKSFGASIHHSSPIHVKKNLLSRLFIPHKFLKKQDFSRFVLDYLIFGNAHLERQKNRTGDVGLKPALTKYTRRGKDDNYYYISHFNKYHTFKKGSIFHLLEPEVNQEIYGLPEYLAALNAAWLNESATLFRRKYYENGSHAGFILYLNDEGLEDEDVDNIRDALKNSKGPGNFRNLLLHSPNGKKDGVQLIPVSEVNARDEFFNIKNVTRDDMYAAHRVPPQIMGVIPSNTSGLGAADTALEVFLQNEILPLQERLAELNQWFGEEVIKFKDYDNKV